MYLIIKIAEHILDLTEYVRYKGLLSAKECSFNRQGHAERGKHKVYPATAGAQSFKTEYSYDNFDRVVQVSSPAGTYSYTYDYKGRILTTKYTNSHEKEATDSTDSASSASFVVSNSYDPAGRLISKKFLRNSQEDAQASDGQGRSALVGSSGDSAGRSQSEIVLCSYEYDKLDRRVKAEVNGVKWTYGYDEFSQLVSASSSDGYVYGYDFDKIGNRKYASRTESGALVASTKFDYNPLNQITGEAFAYDAYGNLIKTPDAEYKYDLRNRLIESRSHEVIVKYSYDPLGQRIKSEEIATRGTKVTEFLMSGMVEQARLELPLPLGEGQGEGGKAMFHTLGLDLAGSLTATGAVGAVLASTSFSSVNSSSTVRCLLETVRYLYDGNGNVIATDDSTGTITARLVYSPFGEQINGPQLPFTFSTKSVDSSGLSYYGFRFYNPQIGRWMSRDPIKEHGNYNAYLGVSNNPTNLFDRLGLVDCCGDKQYNKNTHCCCAGDSLIEKGNVKFNGYCTYLQGGELIGVMQIMCGLKSTITETCNYYEFLLHITMGGLTFGLPFGMGAFSVSLIGADSPSDLTGYTRFGAATGSIGVGISISEIFIGDARSEISYLPWSSGIDVGLDAMVGYAYATNIHETSCR